MGESKSCDLCGDAGPLVLGGRCHPSAPLRVVLDGDVLTLRCYVPSCDREVAVFRVVPRSPAQPEQDVTDGSAERLRREARALRCECDLRDRRWNPLTGRCETCRCRYEAGR